MEKNKKMRNTIINISIFIIIIILTFYIILKDQDINEISRILSNVDIRFILIAIFAMCMYVFCEAININRILKGLGEKVNIFKSIRYVLTVFFYSAITPAASGGQPMGIYYMHRENISVANATLALLIQLSSFQFVYIILGIIGAIVNFDVLKSGLIYLFIFGILSNMGAISLLLIGIFSKRISNTLIKFLVKILKFFRIKNIDKKQERLEKELVAYQNSAIYIKENKTIIIKTILITIIQSLMYFSVPYWIYLSFGLRDTNILRMISLQALLYVTVSIIPSPGSVGVTEGGFLGIFVKVFPETIISSAMILSRGVDFYLLLIISSVIAGLNFFKEKKEIRKEKRLQEKIVN